VGELVLAKNRIYRRINWHECLMRCLAEREDSNRSIRRINGDSTHTVSEACVVSALGDSHCRILGEPAGAEVHKAQTDGYRRTPPRALAKTTLCVRSVQGRGLIRGWGAGTVRVMCVIRW